MPLVEQRQSYDGRPETRIEPVDPQPDLTVGPLNTFFSYPDVDWSGDNETVTHAVLDENVNAVTETLAVRPLTLEITASGFTDEAATLEQYRINEQPVQIRHWVVSSPTAIINSVDGNTVPGLGSDGSGEWKALCNFSISLTETAPASGGN